MQVARQISSLICFLMNNQKIYFIVIRLKTKKVIEEKPGYTDFEMSITQLKVVIAKQKFDPCDSHERHITTLKVVL